MPLDASIPLQTKVPAPPDPIAAYSRVAALQSQLQGQQVQQAQLAGLNQENQQRGMQMQDQQTLRQAFMDSNGNPDQLMSLARQRGVSPSGMMQLQSQILDMKTKGATLEKDQRANLLTKNTAIQSRLASVADEPDPAKQAQLWTQASQGLVTDGTITPQEAAQHPYPGSPGAVKQYVAGLNMADWALREERSGTGAQRQAAADSTYQKMISDAYAGVKTADDLNAANLQLMAKLPGKYAGQLLTKYDPPAVATIANANLAPTERAQIPGMEADTQYKQLKLQGKEPLQPKDVAELNLRNQQLGIEQQNASTNRARLGVEQQKQVFDQGAIQRAARALAGGDLTRLKDIASLRGDQRLQIFDLAKQINPKFNISEVDRKIKMEDWLLNGKGADNLQSFGTFLEHAGGASDAVNGIRLSNTPIINKPLNWWKQNMSGDANYTALIGSLDPVRKEAQNFLLNGHAMYAEDRKSAETILSDNASPAQIQAALTRLGHTAAARENEMNFRYKKVSGHDIQDPFSAEALAGAQKIGVKLPGSQSGQPASSPASTSSAGSPPNGNGAALTNPVIVKQFLDAAGGDKNKARVLAQQSGWKF